MSKRIKKLQKCATCNRRKGPLHFKPWRGQKTVTCTRCRRERQAHRREDRRPEMALKRFRGHRVFISTSM